MSTQPQTQIQITRLITNQFIIGKTAKMEDFIKIEDPYTIILAPDGIQMFPLDEAVVGVRIPKILIDEKNIMYSVEPAGNIKQTYLEAKTGITENKKELII